MLIITRPGIADADLDHICERVESLGLTAHVLRGQQRTVVACVGDDAMLAGVPLLALPGIESVPALAARWKVHRAQAAELLSEPVIDALAQRLRRHLRGERRDPSEVVTLPTTALDQPAPT